ncbi:MAG: transcriptional regulator [Propionibacteriaceae bacterium]|uniref:RNA polymerase sigma-70 region 4 n=1 Tax=Propionibacterium ruminifibrarum TaxID=1962131 RepID=A0A375I415_9ACTN|nr:sugar-binding domain-containing protein [Propionibacterium ruminifibrarum]MBE6476821.1 transcriptional regulator [Propionibacteriaceae bacterium]SPF68162.1 RNA polymerase sigma-70 region 4 [Propionibacterium ruminifibrarum]
MPAKRDQQLLIDAARLYYVDGLDQGQVGARLGLSRSSVSRILHEARSSGLVQIRVVGDDRTVRNGDLERRLVKAFGLREALVADTSTSTDRLSSVARLAGESFARLASGSSRIGFGWGLTIARFIDLLPETSLRPDTRIVPLVGGMPTLDSAPSGNTHLQILADKCGAVAGRFDAPAIVESALTQQAMMNESSVQASLAEARSCDLGFVGIGNYEVQTSRAVMNAMRLSATEKSAVEAARPVGDMLGRYYTIEGVPLGPPTSERVIGIDLDDLRRINTVVGLATGRAKAPGTFGALGTGALDILAVDDVLAEALLAMKN